MKQLSNNIEAFLCLVKAGLWEDRLVHDSSHSEAAEPSARLMVHDSVDWGEVYRLAEEQSVIGLVGAGLEHLLVKPDEMAIRPFLTWVIAQEQQNSALNEFIAYLVKRMQEEGIYTLIVKGQGVAQCYKRPLWRASGDVDFYLSEENFRKARELFRPLADKFEPDNDAAKHINMTLGGHVIEIHEDQHTNLSPRIDRALDTIHKEIFNGGAVRSWQNNQTTVFLPSPNNDVLIVFTHFLKHFYRGGLGLRQICDWSRLLWTYRETLDLRVLESRIKEMGLMSEWKAFAAFAVDYLGMPKEAMPLYDSSKKWKQKADMILDFILEVGNFGHNRDTSYYRAPFLIRKVISGYIRVADSLKHMKIFLMDSVKFMFNALRFGVKSLSLGV